jgi:hypothetical protein
MYTSQLRRQLIVQIMSRMHLVHDNNFVAPQTWDQRSQGSKYLPRCRGRLVDDESNLRASTAYRPIKHTRDWTSYEYGVHGDLQNIGAYKRGRRSSHSDYSRVAETFAGCIPLKAGTVR